MKAYNRIIAIALLSSIAQSSWAQVEVEDSFILEGFNLQRGIRGDIILQNNEEILVTGVTGRDKCRIIKCNIQGEILWNIEHDFMNRDDAHTIGESLKELSQEEFVVQGNTFSHGEIFYRPWVAIFNNDGQLVTERRYDVFGGFGDWRNITMCNDGGFLISGIRTPGDPRYLSVLKLDGDFDVIWYDEYHIGRYGDYYNVGKHLLETDDGDFIFIEWVGEQGNGDLLALKINPDGEIIWSKRLGLSGRDENCVSFVKSNDGTYWIGATSYGQDVQPPLLLIQINSDGDSLTSIRYIVAGFSSMIDLQEGGFLLVGNRYRNQDNYLWLMRTDFKGDSIWYSELRQDRYENTKLVETDNAYLISATGRWDRWIGLTTPDPVIAQRTNLPAGWSIAASVCPPVQPAIDEVFAEVLQRGSLLMVKDQLGRFFIPRLDFNGIPPWDVRQGYMVKTSQPDSLVIVNLPAPADTPIPLRRHWNIVAYLPEAELPAPAAFANLGGNLLRAKDEAGRFYWPRYNYSNMGSLRRGKGYQVKVAEPDTLVWNVREEMRNAECGVRREHVERLVRTGVNMSLLLNVRCEVQSDKRWEVRALSPDGRLVGVSSPFTFQPSLLTGLAVWGDDPTTPEKDGAAEGELLELRLGGAEGEIPVKVEWVEGDGRFQADEFSLARLTLDAEPSPPLAPQDGRFGDRHYAKLTRVIAPLSLHPLNPNPFNSSAQVGFDLPQASVVRLAVLDVRGREVARLMDKHRPAGRHVLPWDADGLPSGVYFVRLTTGGDTRTVKAMMVR